MRNRFLSLLCVLALCLGLLPVTALAAEVDAPNNLYVGNQNVKKGNDTTYWNTYNSGELIQVSDATDDSNDWTVKYDPNTATLTLKNATIKTTHDGNRGAMIYAQSVGSRAVSLTIQLVGENTIVCDSAYYGIYVDAEMSNDSYGTDASLTITGNGSLEVSGSSYGIWVKSGTGNASLNIKNVAVTSSTNGDYAAGVCVQSSTKATGSPQLSLAVDGGSLTTSASEGNDGIQFYVGLFEATGATTSLTVSDNAIVRANGGIKASRVDEPTPSGTGIVFDGTEGTVYGNVELQKDLEIKSGETLTIPDGASLNTNGKTITVESGGKLEGTPTGSGTVKIAPTITTESLPDGEAGTAYSQALAATGDATITWSLASGSTLPAGLSLGTDGTISGKPTTADTYTFTVTATNASGSDSKEFTLTISEPAPIYTISADVDPVGAGTVSGGGSYAAGTSVTLTATPNSGYRFVGWVEDGTTVSTNTSYIFNADKNRSLTALFDRISSGGGDSDPTYSITLPNQVTGGELKLSRRYAEKGETVTLTAVPDEGYELDTLTVTDSKGNEIDLTDQGGNEYTFKMPAGRVTIDVTFRKTGTPLPFADVGETYWAYDEIAWAYENGYMSGTSTTAFTPGGTVTRQQVWMILARAAGANPTDMAAAKAWAVANGISDGTSPGSPVTRQQLAALLYRYAVLYGYDVSVGENTNILSFTDVGQLSEYAIPAMQWAVGAGIINGTGDGSTLTPQGDSTRAQLAVMLYRFMGSM